MTRAIGRLTALKVEKTKEPGMYADGGGLYLRVTPEGARNWVLRYMLDRRPRWMGLGPLALYGLQEARAKALDARRKRHESRRGALSGLGNASTRPKRSHSAKSPRATSLHTRPDGGTANTWRNGKPRSVHMPRRSCPCRCS
jgi:hypothetical protein